MDDDFATDWMDLTLDLPRWQFKDVMLDGDVGLLLRAPKFGHLPMLADMSVAISTGQDFAGWSARRPGEVVIVSWFYRSWIARLIYAAALTRGVEAKER